MDPENARHDRIKEGMAVTDRLHTFLLMAFPDLLAPLGHEDIVNSSRAMPLRLNADFIHRFSDEFVAFSLGML
jgi:hypothetical protein